MSKDTTLNQQFDSKRIHISALGLLDSFKTPTFLGVTSDVALNGLTKFCILVAETDAIGKTVAQLQVSSTSGKIVASRQFNGSTFGEWEVEAHKVGATTFDETLGKPIWLKTINTPVKAVYRFDVTAGATGAGTITFSIGDTDYTVEIEGALTADQAIDTIQQELDAVFIGWDVSADDEGIIFTKDVAGVADELTFADTDETGISGTISVVAEGIADVWVDATGTIVYQ